METLEFTLNDQPVRVGFEPGMNLLQVLRESCHVVSLKDGCSSEGVCGCCTIWVDGRPALACLKKPDSVQGKAITTVEGLPAWKRRVLSACFLASGAVQCGFCTPGIVMRMAALLDRKPNPDISSIRKALAGHICRCTGYLPIVQAVMEASTLWSEDAARELTVSPRAAACGVGASQARYRGQDLVLGAKPFVADMNVEAMVHGAVVLSPHPRALIRALGVEETLARPGVQAVFTARDVPGERCVGLIRQDWPQFVAIGEITRCVGDVLALVVADTPHHARTAAASMAVDYEPLPVVATPEEALAPEAPRIHEGGNVLGVCAFRRGDAETALAEADVVVHGTFSTQRIEHAFLEVEACLATPDGQGVRVYSQGQGVHDDQAQIARILAIPTERVHVELVSTGGAFGGKEDLLIQGQTALAATKLGVPVRTVLTREQSLRMHPKRHPMTLDYTVGADKQGRLKAARVRILGDTGAYASVGAKVLERAAGHCCGPYRVPHADVEARAVYTNNPPCGAMRGFGVNQSSFAMEGILDRLAEKLDMDALDIRRVNLLTPGDRFITGQIMDPSCRGLKRCLDAVEPAYRTARYAGIACGIKNTGIGNGMADTGRVVLRVLGTHKLEILTGFTEMGQGLFTVLTQVVNEETGLDPAIMALRTCSEEGVRCGMTTASRATALTTAAAQQASRDLAAAMGPRGLEPLVGREFKGEFICDITVAPTVDTPDPRTHMTFGYAAQVAILDDSGRLQKVVAAHDVGRAINPQACRGQIEGGIHMGLGQALTEDFPCEHGTPVSLRFRDLGILMAEDMPLVEVILIEEADEHGGYGSKGVGEIGLVPTAGAVAGALLRFDGKFRSQLPMRDTPTARHLKARRPRPKPERT